MKLETYQNIIDEYWQEFDVYIAFMDSNAVHEILSPQYGFDIEVGLMNIIVLKIILIL